MTVESCLGLCAKRTMLALRADCLPVLLILVFSTAGVEAAQWAYPIKLSATKTYLTDQNGKPFCLIGDQDGCFFSHLTRSDMDYYLSDRQSKKFNTCWALLHNPWCMTNKEGESLFSNPRDLSTINSRYFAMVDYAMKRAAEKDFMFLIFPVWLGYACSKPEGGSYDELAANGIEKCRQYGRYLGQKFANYGNLIWVMGGDCDPGDKYRPYISAIAQGILEFDKRHLMTGHCQRMTSALDQYSNESWLTLNSTYAKPPVYTEAIYDYKRYSRLPSFLIEGWYEGSNDMTRLALRQQAYQSILSGMRGYVNGRSTFLTTGWKESLNWDGEKDVSRMANLIFGIPHHLLAPDLDHTVMTSGWGTWGSTTDYVPVARSTDGKCIIAHLPNIRDVTIDMSKLCGPARARWFDPTNGTFTTISASVPNTGKKSFKPAQNNASGAPDWVLVLDVGSVTGLSGKAISAGRRAAGRDRIIITGDRRGMVGEDSRLFDIRGRLRGDTQGTSLPTSGAQGIVAETGRSR